MTTTAYKDQGLRYMKTYRKGLIFTEMQAFKYKKHM